MSEASTLHQELIVIDGQQINRWDDEVIAEQRRGGVTCLNATCSVWEDAREAIANIAAWYRRVRLNGQHLRIVANADDIRNAKQQGKLGVMLGFQNASPFEDDLSLVEVFYRLGVRVVQLTYNIQNLLGSSCYDPVDNGLTRFGQGVVREMNRLGMLVDLSHVGERTSRDAIEFSDRPVAITHANPSWMCDVARNKSDALLQVLAEHGGVIGCTAYPPFIGGREKTLDDFCAMVERLVEQIGIEHVAIGTDLTRKCISEDLSWLRNGRWRFPEPGQRLEWPEWPDWFRSAADFPNITEGLMRRGFSRDHVSAVMGGNWLRLFDETLGADAVSGAKAVASV